MISMGPGLAPGPVHLGKRGNPGEPGGESDMVRAARGWARPIEMTGREPAAVLWHVSAMEASLCCEMQPKFPRRCATASAVVEPSR
jgi:hypothetical protein